ncbi:MAG: DNA polymerase III subunit beta [Candidatus Competibacteraceae bacterium]|nr:DNA polymerase III subunit beta [Candidatus Competibacteraceae bacterium]
MRIQTQVEQLLKPLQNVVGVVERRQTLPVLSNVLLVAREEELTLTGTDLEVELMATVRLPVDEAGEATLPARKLLDILRSLPEDATVTLVVQGDRARLTSGRSRFSLVTLPASDFPTVEDLPFDIQLRLPQSTLRGLIERTHFAMAQQDVRYYLNGLLLDREGTTIRTVATDGHRLALCEASIEDQDAATTDHQVILPRKGVQELLRLLGESDTQVLLCIGANHLQATVGDIRFTSKLIDGKFPDYRRVIPRDGERVVLADRLVLKNALSRTAILSSDKYRGVRLQMEELLLRLQAHNPEQEEAEEEVEVNYSGEAMEIGFNVTYLLDALGALGGELVKLSFTDANSSCLIQESDSSACQYVVMPMRL